MTCVLSGMTGFARVSGECDWGFWAWEAKSVNGRSLDVRVSLPPGAEMLEKDVKALAAMHFSRGSLQLALRLELSGAAPESLRIDHALLATLADAVTRIAGSRPGPDAIARLMNIRGVVEAGTQSLRDVMGRDGMMPVMLEGARAALELLLGERRAEGSALANVLGGLLDQATALVGEIRGHALAQPELLRAKLMRQLAEMEIDGQVDPERFAAEAAFAAARADVREEVDRLGAHLQAGREILSAGSPAGRRLEFLVQEMNREANTLCSKSASLDLTNAGLALKGVIDQIREQAANVE